MIPPKQWRRKWQPTPVSFLGNPMGRGAWRATVRGVTEVKHDLVTKQPPPKKQTGGPLESTSPSQSFG